MSRLKKQNLSKNKSKPAITNRFQFQKHKTLHRVLISSLIMVVLVLLLLYGPYAGFRNFWISTAMHTSDHQYLATWFFPQKTIDRVLAMNKVFALEEKTTSISKFEQKNDMQIDLLQIQAKNSNGYILKIHDPSRVSVAKAANDQGRLLEEISAESKAVAAINASAYRQNQSKGLPLGLVIIDGQIVEKGLEPRHSVIGFNRNNELVLGIYFDWELPGLSLRDAVEYGPFLIINGKKAVISGNGGGLAPRTAIGQTSDGTILFIVMDGRQLESFGASMQELQNIFHEHGAVNAACLDGGASVSMFYNGSIINSVNAKEDNRKLPNAFIVR